MATIFVVSGLVGICVALFGGLKKLFPEKYQGEHSCNASEWEQRNNPQG